MNDIMEDMKYLKAYNPNATPRDIDDWVRNKRPYVEFTRLAHMYGYGVNDDDLKNGYNAMSDEATKRIRNQALYNYNNYTTKGKKTLSYLSDQYDPSQYSAEDNEIFTSYVNTHEVYDPDEYKLYYADKRYKYEDTVEDRAAKAKGEKPLRYQVTDIIAAKLNTLGPNPNRDQVLNLINSDPYMRDLAAAAKQRQKEAAEGKGGYSFQGTPAYKDFDAEGLKALGYDPVDGWIPLLAQYDPDPDLQTVPTPEQMQMEEKMKEYNPELGVKEAIAQIVPAIQGNTAMAEQFVDEHADAFKAAGYDLAEVKEWAKDYANRYAQAVFMEGERQAEMEQNRQARYDKFGDDLRKFILAKSLQVGNAENTLPEDKHNLYIYMKGEIDNVMKMPDRHDRMQLLCLFAENFGLDVSKQYALMEKYDIVRPFDYEKDAKDVRPGGSISAKQRKDALEIKALGDISKLPFNDKFKVAMFSHKYGTTVDETTKKMEEDDKSYEVLYGHKPPPDDDFNAQLAVDIGINNALAVGFNSFVKGATFNIFGTGDTLQSRIASSFSEDEKAIAEAVLNAEAEHPVASIVGNVASIFVPGGGIAKGAGLLLKGAKAVSSAAKGARVFKGIAPAFFKAHPLIDKMAVGSITGMAYSGISSVMAGRPAEQVATDMLAGGGIGGVLGAGGHVFSKILRRIVRWKDVPETEKVSMLAGELESAAKDPDVVKAFADSLPRVTDDIFKAADGTQATLANRVWTKTTLSAESKSISALTSSDKNFRIVRQKGGYVIGLQAGENTGFRAIGKADSLGRTERLINQADTAMKYSRTGGRAAAQAGRKHPLTQSEYNAMIGEQTAQASPRSAMGEMAPAGTKRPLTQSEYNAMIGERPAQAAPRSAKEPLPVPDTVGGKSVEGRSVEGVSAGKAEQPAIVGAGKTRDVGTLETDRFIEGLLGRQSNESTKSITVYRVEGGSGNKASRIRITIKADGRISISKKDVNLHVSLENAEHAQYFLNNKRKGGNIVAFDIPKWLYDFIKENEISQKDYWKNPRNQGGTAPKRVDLNQPGKPYELPPPWIEWLEEYATNGRIIKPE